MKPLVDACLPVEWVDFLRRHGHECVPWLHVGTPQAPDSEIMSWAREHGFVVVTHDLDFGRLLALSQATHPSVIQFRAADIRPAALGDLVLRALCQHRALLEGELGEGALITVETERWRTRILPLAPD